MIELANDIPKEILQILYNIDTARINPKQVTNWLDIVKSNYQHYFENRKTAPVLVKHNLDLPKQMVELLNKIDFNLNPLKRGIYLTAMKLWISQNLPMRQK